MFRLTYRLRRERMWHDFGFRYERMNECDLRAFRLRYPKYKFRLVFHPVF